jgi:glycogenin glucosyltransferase
MNYGYFTLASKEYVPGAVCLVKSLRRFTDLPINVISIDLSADDRYLLESHGARIKDFPRIGSAGAKTQPWHKNPDFANNCFMKLHLWNTEYDKLIYLDSDMLVIRNIDHLFEIQSKFAACPSYSQSFDRKTRRLLSAGYSEKLFNGGFLVLEPNISTFNKLMRDKDFLINREDPSDQGYLNMVYDGTWTRLPSWYNATRRVFMVAPDEWKAMGENLAVIHYTIEKPWVQSVPKCEEIENLWWECYKS